jgi:hypothetical protein
MRKLKIIEHISLDGVIQHSRDDDDFFAEGTPAHPFELVSTTTTPTGVILTTYKVVGPLKGA